MTIFVLRDELDLAAARGGGDAGETVAQTGLVTYAGGSSNGNGIYRYPVQINVFTPSKTKTLKVTFT